MTPLKRTAPSLRPRSVDDRAPVLLVVEDDADTRQLYVEYLTFQGFRVVAVGNGLSAMAEARDRRPDLIVMDLALPQLNGWEATRRLKSDPRTAHIPIVACTADAFPGSAERALLAGCDAYLVKPCLPEDLVIEIRRHLVDSSRRQA